MTNDFIKYLKTLKPADWSTKIDDQWTVKDIVAHLVGWDKESAIQIPLIWQTRRKPWFMNVTNWDDFNKKSIEYYKDYTPQQLLDEWQKYLDQIQKETQEIGEDNMHSHPELFSWYFEDTDFDETGVSHLTEHWERIKSIVLKK